jgi:hypothetical protein
VSSFFSVIGTKARMLPPPPPPPPASISLETASGLSLSSLVEVPTPVEHVAPHFDGGSSSGPEVLTRCTISSLQQLSPQIIESLLDLLVARLRSSFVARPAAAVVSSGDHSVAHLISEAQLPNADIMMGSGASAAVPSSSGSSSQATSSQLSGQHPQAHTPHPSMGRCSADGVGRHSASQWQ